MGVTRRTGAGKRELRRYSRPNQRIGVVKRETCRYSLGIGRIEREMRRIAS